MNTCANDSAAAEDKSDAFAKVEAHALRLITQRTRGWHFLRRIVWLTSTRCYGLSMLALTPSSKHKTFPYNRQINLPAHRKGARLELTFQLTTCVTYLFISRWYPLSRSHQHASLHDVVVHVSCRCQSCHRGCRLSSRRAVRPLRQRRSPEARH